MAFNQYQSAADPVVSKLPQTERIAIFRTLGEIDPYESDDAIRNTSRDLHDAMAIDGIPFPWIGSSEPDPYGGRRHS